MVTVNPVKAHWKFLLAEGVVLILLGALAIIVPLAASLAVELLVGWLLLLSGVIGLVSTFGSRRVPGFGWSLLSAAAGIVAGFILISRPLNGVLTLTIMLSAFLVVEGVVSILYALAHRRELSGRWSMMLLSGVIDLILAGFVFAGLPGTAGWAIGVLVGVNLLTGGAALTAMALHARNA